MEVHHHPHVEKKNFKEYFLEFLMIFLAVTMGFFAEQMRESVADHNREKEFMKSMLEDLKTDTAKINSFSMQANVALTQMDSLIHLMQSRDRAKYGRTMYYFGRTITTKLRRFELNERTYEEMKNSGSLRLIRDGALSDSVSKYYASQTHFKEQSEIQIQEMIAYIHSAVKVFDGAVFQNMLQKSPYRVNPPQGNPQLITNDAAIINEFVGLLHYYSAEVLINLSYAVQEKDVTIRLIKMIQKKYNLQ
ncbi:hypothetical protein FW778_03710 [Ginsengibacter hankyongi]|uniref:Uncharacterized protein n=1 Tax=Ginsengibacter hankyongi TaxID=2607284 RepID=A0A5J5IJB4_9BACT|nr:hypothetical protein [Ginsengibacter hankyongi]KAA9041155.1 hypothetical protein FW778_03710 [Ginsengibacter hankyongi]